MTSPKLIGNRTREAAISRSRDSEGFTLIEVMVVVAILALTLTIGYPAFVSMRQRQGLTRAQTDLQEACRDARRHAILTAQPTFLVFHPLEGTFEGGGFHGQFPADVHIDIMGVNFVECENADEAQVRFNPNGTSDEFTIVIEGANGEKTQLSLEPITALALVQQIR